MISGGNLSNILKSLISNEMLDMHTCLPATLEKYYPDTNRADVRPLLKYQTKRIQEPVELPLIQDVPIQELRYSDNAWIKLPIKEGIKVTLFFVERSIDDYLEKGANVLPSDPRRFHLQDAFVVPGFFSTPDQIKTKGSPDDLEIVNEQTSIILSKESVKIQKGRDDLLNIIELLLAQLQKTMVNDGSGGPWPLMSKDITAYQNLENKIKNIRGI